MYDKATIRVKISTQTFFFVDSINTRLTTPDAAIDPQTVTHPTPYFTVFVTCLLLKASFLFRHIINGFFCTKYLKLTFTSENNIISKSLRQV